MILDNLSAHKTKIVAAFLDEHPNVTLHFTPTYSSWLNQVELSFSKVQWNVLSRGVFTSTADLVRKPRRYIRAYAQHAKLFRWKYAGFIMANLLPGQSTSVRSCVSQQVVERISDLGAFVAIDEPAARRSNLTLTV